MNRAFLEQELSRIEGRAHTITRLVERQREVLARLEAASGPSVPAARRLLRSLEDLQALHHTRQSRVGDQLLVLTAKLLQAH